MAEPPSSRPGFDNVDSEEPKHRFALGEVVSGRYRVERLLGAGAMCSVFGAIHVVTGHEVALKVPQPWLMEHHDLIERFSREATVTAHVRSPHIVQMLDFLHLDDGTPVLVMEWLHGQTLEEVLDVHVLLTPVELFPILCDVLEALDALHACDLIHRDLKPSNLFLADSDQGYIVKLIDFGLSKWRRDAADRSRRTRTGEQLGTFAFMAPEAWQDSKRVDARADLFSVGALAYLALVGSSPYGDEGHEIVMALFAGTNEPQAVVLADGVVDGGFSNIILKALMRKPEERWQRAGEFLQALDSWMSRTVGEFPNRSLRGSQRVQRRHPNETWNRETTRSLPPIGAFVFDRIGDLHASQVRAKDGIYAGTRLATEAVLEEDDAVARTKRRLAAIELLSSLELMLLTRLQTAKDNRYGKNLEKTLWQELLAAAQPGKGTRTYGERRLLAYLERGECPSIAVMARWLASPSRLQPLELSNRIQLALGLIPGLEDELVIAGQLRNVLAHRAEYELNAEGSLEEADVWAVRVELSSGAEVDVPQGALDELIWLCSCVAERKMRPKQGSALP